MAADRLKKAKRAIEDAIDYIGRAKRSTDDSNVQSKLRQSENELDRALSEIKKAMRELDS